MKLPDIRHLPAPSARRAGGGTLPQWAACAGFGLLLALAWQAWLVNPVLSCRKGEWPGLTACPQINGVGIEQTVIRLEERLTRNPGDSRAAVDLAVYLHQSSAASEMRRREALSKAMTMAPHNADVLRLRAARALPQQNWQEAVDALLPLAQYHRDPASIQALADLVGRAPLDPGIQTALLAAVDQQPGWLEPVLHRMIQDKVPMATLMPLVNRAIAGHGLPGKLGQWLIPPLKAEGLWLEAYAVWAHLWNQPLPLLFNGDFESAFIQGGFDWETPGERDGHRAGARASRIGRGERGQVLQVELTGKEIRPPVARQHLMLPPGRYRLTGQWQSRDLQSAQGMAWVVTCTPTGQELGRSPALKATGKEWADFQLTWSVPSDCGTAISLQLQPYATYEGQVGMRGEMLFDRMDITREDARP